MRGFICPLTDFVFNISGVSSHSFLQKKTISVTGLVTDNPTMQQVVLGYIVLVALIKWSDYTYLSFPHAHTQYKQKRPLFCAQMLLENINNFSF